jgi:hypothetical protein
LCTKIPLGILPAQRSFHERKKKSGSRKFWRDLLIIIPLEVNIAMRPLTLRAPIGNSMACNKKIAADQRLLCDPLSGLGFNASGHLSLLFHLHGSTVPLNCLWWWEWSTCVLFNNHETSMAMEHWQGGW